ncbi:MAG: alpha/beta hydrolase [Acidobacteria bacterium]|nr:alpha/beta hydrolase [Acidobacteriota bacterium]
MKIEAERKACQAPDGVTIVYSVAGKGGPALLFIHGGMADRSFFEAQLDALSDRWRVVALDLAGHGESGTNRATWGIPQFASDVRAVADAERLERVILFGNSLGGPVAIEAALLLPGRAVGVVGIDTFQDLGQTSSPEREREQADFFRERAAALRSDHAAAIREMARMMFHADADPALVADVERRLLKTPAPVASSMLASVTGYSQNAAARRLTIPLRSIQGDLYPIDVRAARTVKADFDVIVMKHVGHYPMLERPGEFNDHVATLVAALTT